MARTRRPYRCATPPADIGTTSITASVPNQTVRAKRATLEAQWKTNVKVKAPRGGSYLWAMTGPVSRDGNYCITVKVRGIKASEYWLPYRLAANLWYDVVGDTLENALRDDAGLNAKDEDYALADYRERRGL